MTKAKKDSKKRKQLSSRKKLLIFKNADYSCEYCGIRGAKHIDLTIDHVVPLIKGGRDDESNMACVCYQCNQDKGSLLLTQFIRAFELPMTRQLARHL
jgi:5-methylcytosine-specific restriction endonuclease McrA